jgi:hypothetical protein
MKGKSTHGMRHATGAASAALASALVLLLVRPAFAQPGGPGGDREPAPATERSIIHGPFHLSAKDLGRLPGGPARFARVELTPQDADSVGCERCLDVELGPGEGTEDPSAATPRPTTQFTVDGIGFVDPQIAASSTHLVLSTTGWVAFYEKSGQKLGPKAGSSLVNPIRTRDFFSAVWKSSSNSINNVLNLPPGADCNPADTFASDTFCINSYYDTRAIFDPHRKRFFVLALAINRNSKVEELVCGTEFDIARRSSRRTKVLLAVSLSEDPRDGWWIYWWDAVVGDGACNDPAGCPGSEFLPGDAGDYASIGIDDRFFLVTVGVARRDPTTADCETHLNTVSPRYTRIDAVDANGLVTGGPALGLTIWDIPHPAVPGQVVTGLVQPALHHMAHPFGRSFLAQTMDSDELVIFGLRWVPALNLFELPAAILPVAEWGAPRDAPQKATVDFPAPNPLEMTNLGNNVLKAVYRDGFLYTTWFSKKEWDQAMPALSTLNAVRVNKTFVGLFPLMPAASDVDRTFGLRNGFDDPATAFVDYGWPTVDVNSSGHILLAYMRSSPDHFPEARFTVRLAGDPDVRPSRLLMGGEMPYVDQNKLGDPASAVGQVDLSGTSVDGFDDESIWLVEPYAFKPTDPKKADRNFRLAVGKVFGRKRSDLTFSRLDPAPPFTLEPGDTITIGLTIRNQGDGGAAPTMTRLFLEPFDGGRAPRFEIAAVPADPIPSGSDFDRVVSASLPVGLRSGRYAIVGVADADHQEAEYSESNNEERSQRWLFLRPQRVRKP